MRAGARLLTAVFLFALICFSTSASADEAVSATCPYCGKPFTVDRHALGGATEIRCPNCGKMVEASKVCGEAPCKPWSVGADMSFLNKYVSRGVVATNGWVFQPDVWATYKGLTATVWANMDLSGRNRLRGRFSEFDISLDYSGSIGGLGYSAGDVYYAYPGASARDTGELYAGVGLDVFLKPRLVVYYDYWQVGGFYGQLSISHGFELPEVVKQAKASLNLYAQAGWGSRDFNRYYFGTTQAAFTDMVFTAALPVTLFDSVTVKPSVQFSSVLDRAIRMQNAHNDNVVYGVTVSAGY